MKHSQTTRLTLIAISFGFIEGCGAMAQQESRQARAAPVTDTDTTETDGLDAEMNELEGQLVVDSKGQPVADCPTAKELVDTLCGLAEKICEIARRQPQSISLRKKCDDGRSRCAVARDSMGQRCP